MFLGIRLRLHPKTSDFLRFRLRNPGANKKNERNAVVTMFLYCRCPFLARREQNLLSRPGGVEINLIVLSCSRYLWRPRLYIIAQQRRKRFLLEDFWHVQTNHIMKKKKWKPQVSKEFLPCRLFPIGRVIRTWCALRSVRASSCDNRLVCSNVWR